MLQQVFSRRTGGNGIRVSSVMSARFSALPAAIFLFLAHVLPSQAQIAAAGDANRLNAIEEQLRMLTGEVDRLSQKVRQLEAAAGVAGAGAVAAPTANAGAPAPAGTNGGQTVLGAPPAPLQPEPAGDADAGHVVVSCAR